MIRNPTLASAPSGTSAAEAGVSASRSNRYFCRSRSGPQRGFAARRNPANGLTAGSSEDSRRTKPARPAAAERAGFVRRLSSEDPAVKPFAGFLRAAKPRCGPLRDRQKYLFERDADTPASAALVPLGADASVGFLIIGNRNPDYFHPGQRVDFLARLGELLSVALVDEHAAPVS